MTTTDRRAAVSADSVAMRVVAPRNYPARTVALPCDRCGAKVRTLSLYLGHRASERQPDGYYSVDGLRLCAACLKAALDILEREP
jgi:hypothetical protein